MPNLYPYQAEGVEAIFNFFANGNHGVILGDQPGLGKTPQGLVVIEKMGCMHVLIVSPSSLKINWRREAETWLEKEYVMHVLTGRGAAPWTPGFPSIDIINYDILADVDFDQCEYDLIIYDEAHLLKTPDARRTVAAAGICTSKRLLLTGTPIINRPKEVWQLMLLCGVCQPEDFHQFGLKFCAARQVMDFRTKWTGPKGARVRKTVRELTWNYDGHSNLEELNYWLRQKCMVRRLKADVLTELPGKTRQIIELPGYEHNGAAVDKLRDLKGLLKNTTYEASVAKLQDEIQVAFEEIALIRHETALEKLDQCLSFVDSALGESDKIVIFAHHKDVIAETLEHYQNQGIKAVALVGGMSDAAKQRSVDAFQDDPECRLFIGNIAAAGVGITLTAASRVIFLELDWSPAQMSQCEDRCDRIGQTCNVLVQHLVYENSIDCRIAKRLVEKQKIIESAIDGPTSGAVDWLSELSN